MVDIPIACSSSMGASSTGGIFVDGLPFSPPWAACYNYRLWLPIRRCRRWTGTRLRCVAASHRRFGRREPTAKSFCALITSGPAPAAPAARDGRGKTKTPGFGRAREGSAESSRGNLSLAQRQMLPQSAGVERPQRRAFLLPSVTGCRAGSHKTRPKRSGSLISLSGATYS